MTRLDLVRGARAVTAALLALAVLLGVLSVVQAVERPGSRAAATGPAGCTDVRHVQCRTIDVGGRQVRYAFLGAGDTRAEVALFDIGGPGTSVFGEQWPTGYETLLEPRLAGRRSLVLEEPWVTAVMPQKCRDALTAWFVAAHAGDARGADLVDRCALGRGRWGWTAATFRQAVEAVESVEDVRVEGLVAASFGARRALYLGPGVEWAVLANPAPSAMRGDVYLAERERGVLGMLQQQCACGDDVLERLEATAVAATSAELTSRSVPITRADVGAAALALAYQAHAPGADYVERFWAADPEVIGVLADSVWARYGTSSVSPSYLAYLDEVCAAYRPWPGGHDDGGVVAIALSALHAPCADFPADDASVVTALPSGVRTCVSSQSADPIAPPAFVRTWRTPDHTVTQDGASHTNVDGVIACLEQLRVAPAPS